MRTARAIRIRDDEIAAARRKRRRAAEEETPPEETSPALIFNIASNSMYVGQVV